MVLSLRSAEWTERLGRITVALSWSGLPRPDEILHPTWEGRPQGRIAIGKPLSWPISFKDERKATRTRPQAI